MLKLSNNIHKINKIFLLNFYALDFNKKYYTGFVYKKKMQGLFLTEKLTADTQISDTHTLYFNEA